MSSSPQPTDRRVSPELLATVLLVLAYIVWILSLPAWPSQDGPIHLYYVHVMRELLSHHATVYSRYYTIKHVLPPYALYYYALLVLSKFCSLLIADRLVLCVYLVLFVFGFRYLAQEVGSSADLSHAAGVAARAQLVDGHGIPQLLPLACSGFLGHGAMAAFHGDMPWCAGWYSFSWLRPLR